MTARYLEPSGIIVRREDLTIPKAEALANAFVEDSIQFATFVECRSH